MENGMGYVEQPAQYAQDANGVVVNGMGGVMPVVGGMSAPPVGVMTTGITRVYVGNLSWETEWQDLKDHMRTAGEVVRADVMRDASGRSKGCGIVEYRTPAEAQEAINTLLDTELKGRLIFVREDREAAAVVGGGGGPPMGGGPRGSGNQNARVYVGNLAWDVAWQDLKDHMRGLGGEVIRADVMTDQGGRSRGCGIVEYAEPEQATQAIEQLNNSELKNRMIFVREDRESGTPGGGHHQQQMHHHNHQQQQMVGQMQMGPMGAFGGQPFAAGPGALMGQSMGGHMQQMQMHQQQHGSGGHQGGGGGAMPQATGNRIYVGNLAWTVEWQELKDHMRTVGKVVHADVLQDGDGRSKGCGIVEYEDIRGANRAIRELNNTALGGRPIFVREDREQQNPRQRQRGGGRGEMANGGGGRGGGGGGENLAGRQLYVGNLSFETTWADLKDHFRTAGEVERADVMMDGSRRSKGWGTVRFRTQEEAQSAIQELNGTELGSRQIEVREDSKTGGGGGGGSYPKAGNAKAGATAAAAASADPVGATEAAAPAASATVAPISTTS
ncbi:conserved unknown protein [Ectocarpus siliculosus]|uniref:RRM domain-containing protein n=1 Tax=Ectocarpus siliculosus TaxID=2880 RepID=D8LGN3_ECTSI|nr:conserved unknown protein [Ectocarpus siliculosus]|eukprot:CBN75775.1 conserved unknown protein [Ectocarpus siliculosus]